MLTRLFTVSAAVFVLGSALGQGHVPGRVLVKFRDGVPDSRAHGVLRSVQGETVQMLEGLGVKVVSLPAQANERAVAAVLGRKAEVEFAEVDAYVEPASVPFVPNDPWFAGGVWGYCAQWALLQIQAPAAWGITRGDSSVVVAVLDTGVGSTHEDLAGKVVGGWNVVGNDSNSSDVSSHGTACAGIVAAASNNGIGIASVGFNTSVMPIRVTDSSGNASLSSFATGLRWAADHGARVASISWYPMWSSSTVISACNYFRSMGGLVVVSAGNNGAQQNVSDLPSMIVVGATADPSDNLASYSNWGALIDLVAPGEAYTTQNPIYAPIYISVAGTSISAPYVAGTIALMWATNPGLSNVQVESMLMSATDDRGVVGRDSRFGWGRLNAYRAVLAAAGVGSEQDSTAPTVSITAPAAGATVSGTVQVTASAQDNVGVSRVELYLNGNLVQTLTQAPYTMNWNTNTSANGSQALVAKAYDAAGNSGVASHAVTVSNQSADATPPTVSIVSPSSGSSVGNRTTVTVNAADNVRVTRVELYVDGVLTASSSSAPFSMRWNSRNASSGTHALTAKAFDAAGNSTTSTAVIVTR